MEVCLRFLLISVALAATCNGQAPTTVIDGKTCSLHQKNITVVAGWPYRHNCFPEEGVVEGWCLDYYYDDSTYTLQCRATNITNGMVISNTSTDCIDYPDAELNFLSVNPTGTPSWQLFVSAEESSSMAAPLCRVYNVTFTPKVEASTCEGSAATFSSFISSVSNGQPTFTLNCPVDAQVDATQVTVEWLHECGPLPPNRTEQRPGSLGLPALHLSDVRYDLAGNYTCAVTYNGMTRFFHVAICVEPPAATEAPLVKCERDNTEVFVGDDVTFTCAISFGSGIPPVLFFTTFWFKESEEICVNGRANETSTNGNDTDTSCIYFIENPFGQSCFNQASDEKVIITANLTLRNVQKDDFGNYTITVRTPSNNETETITLSEKPQPPPIPLIVGLVVGISLFVIIAGILLYVFRFYVKVYWKKWFGAYERDDRETDAYISYHAQLNLDAGARDLAMGAREVTTTELRSLGFDRINDQHKNFEPGLVAEVVMNAVQKSHRVVIILSHEYIQEEKSIANLQQAVMENIETGKKIIFVMLPGTMEMAKQRAKDGQDRYRMIGRLLKCCHAIQWSNRSDFNKNKFRLHLEYAMPKLRHRNLTLENGSNIYENGHALSEVNGGNRIGVEIGEKENHM